MKNQIKNNKQPYFFGRVVWLVFLVVWIVSCDSMESVHQKYADESKRVYLGMPDSLVSFPGVGRIKLVWYANADPKLETTVIYWNNRQDSIEKPFTRIQDGIQKDSVIIDKNMDGTPLIEGDYIFECLYKNGKGERSLPVSVRGKSFGDVYASALRSRYVAGLSSMGFDHTTQSSTVKIRWSDAPEGCIGTKVTYKKRSTGEEVVISVGEADTETVLTDVGNRLEHADDVLYVSSVYAPSGSIDPMDSPAQKWQLVHYMASGTRVEQTIYTGNNMTFTFTYVNQDKTLTLLNATENSRTYDCSRVAELSPLTPNISLQAIINESHAVNISGYYADPLNEISNITSENSTFDPATNHLTMRYTVKTPNGSYAVTETLVPKTTPVEIAAEKPFGDMRAVIPGDISGSAAGSFDMIYDGIFGWVENAWLTASNSTSASFTIDLKKTMKLTRMIVHPYQSVSGDFTFNSIFNPRECEIWGTAEIDESKLADAAYWADAVDPTGTFKEDWENLGYYEFERLDLRGWSSALQAQRGAIGHHVILPESAKPVRYIRYFHRNQGADNPYYFYMGELSFFGYVQ